MSHILIDARIINSSTGRYVERLVTYLDKLDTTNRYTVVVPTKDLHFWKPTNPNFTVIGADYANYSVAEQLGFNGFIAGLKPDLVHFCMPQQPILYKGKTVTTFHDLTLLKTYNSDKNWFVFHAKQLVGAKIFRKVVKKSDALIAISEFTKKEMIGKLDAPTKKIRVIYEASDVSTVKPATYKQLKKTDDYLLYVGQQSDYKNIKRLGDAHQLLLAQHPNLKLVLVGKKNAAAITNEEYFAERGYKNIHFTDFVSDEQLAWLYQHAKAYIFPSLMEGFGLPGLEAMEYGVPVISSNATCLPEIYGKAAHYFDPHDSSAIAEAVNKVLSNPTLAQKLVKAGYKQVSKYSWEKQARETLEVYEQVLKS